MPNFFESPQILQQPNPEPPGFNLLRDMLMRRIFQQNANPYGLNPSFKGNFQFNPQGGRGLMNPMTGGYGGPMGGGGGMGAPGGGFGGPLGGGSGISMGAGNPGLMQLLQQIIGSGGGGGGMPMGRSGPPTVGFRPPMGAPGPAQPPPQPPGGSTGPRYDGDPYSPDPMPGSSAAGGAGPWANFGMPGWQPPPAPMPQSVPPLWNPSSGPGPIAGTASPGQPGPPTVAPRAPTGPPDRSRQPNAPMAPTPPPGPGNVTTQPMQPTPNPEPARPAPTVAGTPPPPGGGSTAVPPPQPTTTAPAPSPWANWGMPGGAYDAEPTGGAGGDTPPVHPALLQFLQDLMLGLTPGNPGGDVAQREIDRLRAQRHGTPGAAPNNWREAHDPTGKADELEGYGAAPFAVRPPTNFSRFQAPRAYAPHRLALGMTGSKGF